MTADEVVSYLLAPIRLVFWIISLPIRLIGWLASRIRAYDPEKTICPACGFKGEKATAYRSCSIRFIRTEGPEKGALLCNCFRCQCTYSTKLFAPADKWLNPLVITKEERLKKVAAQGSI